MSDHYFFNKEKFKHIVYEDDVPLKEKVFIFEDYTWDSLKKKINELDYKLHSGSISNRHILSPVEIRLAHFLTCMEGLRKNPTNESFILNKKIRKSEAEQYV